MKWIRPWGKNWVPFQRRDLVRIKILKKNASSGEGEGYKQTGPVINESIGNGHVFDHPAASPDLSLIIFFHLEWAPAFMAHGKSPLPREHIILSNKISSIGIVKPVLHRVEQQLVFNCSQKITQSSAILWTLLLSNEKNTLKFRIKVSLNPILSPYSIISR